MNQQEIKAFLDSYATKRSRTIVIVDYGNVEKWKVNLGWKVGIRELAQLIKYFSEGDQTLRRFYYGSDYGKNEKNRTLVEWSRARLEMAGWNRFEVVTKRVKYIHSAMNVIGFEKKCDLDVEMTVDLIKMREMYDHIVLFSGDGDLMCAFRYLKEFDVASCIVFGARAHIGREVFDAKNDRIVDEVYFAEDFEYRIRDKYSR